MEKKNRKTKRDIVEDLEIENIKLENAKLVLEMKKLELEQRKLEAEEKKFQNENHLIELKKSYLICKLNAEFPECMLHVNPACM